MLHKVIKKFFKLSIEVLNGTRVAFVFLAFFTILYWLLQLGNVAFIKPFAPIFESIKNFTHLFYNRIVTIDSSQIDFAFLVASFVMIFIAWGLKFAVEYLELAQRKYDKAHSEMKLRKEELFNISLEHEYQRHEKKNNKTAFLVKFIATNLAKDSFFDKDVNVGVEQIQKEAVLEFSEKLSKTLKFQMKTLDNAIFLYFDTFKNVEHITELIENTINEIKTKHREKKWLIDSCVAVEVYAREEDLALKNKSLITLIRLNLKNKIVCLATFKQRYSLEEDQKFTLEQEGMYSIEGKNETVFFFR